MATTYTENYHLGKQENHADKFRMDVITANMDIIDEQIKKNEDEIASAKGTYTTLSDRLNAIESEQESQEAALDEDRFALVEMVDSGAKNIVNLQAPTASRDTTYTLADNGAVIMSVSSRSWTQYIIDNVAVVTGKKYTLHLMAEDVTGDTSAFSVFVYQGGASTIVSNGNLTNNQVLLNFTAPTSTIKIGIYLNNDNTARSCSAKCKLMICAKPSWDISQAYQQYIPSNEELAENKVNAILTAIPSGVSLADFANSLPVGVHHCFYNSTNNAPDVPVSVHGYVEIHKYSAVTGDMAFNPISTTYQVNKYRKILIGGVWRNWVVFTGAELEGGV